MVTDMADARRPQGTQAGRLPGLMAWCVLVAVLGAMLAGMLAAPAHAQQRRTTPAAASSPMDTLATRLGLVTGAANRMTAASVRTTGNTRTWTNLQVTTEAGETTRIGTVTLEALDPVVSANSRFRLQMADIADSGGSVERVELVGAFAGASGSVPRPLQPAPLPSRPAPRCV